MMPHLRNEVLRLLARILIRSGTFRRHLGAIDPLYDPDFLRAAALVRNASDSEAIFVRDLVRALDARADSLQDIWVLHEMARKQGGYFVEFGAGDGIALSSTWPLERDFGWRGILAEPNPAWHECLPRNRPLAAIDLRCVYRETGSKLAFAATRHALLSTIREFVDRDGHAKSRNEHAVIEVETVSLNDLLRSHGAPRKIDYICIDTEGSELAILQAFDFDAWDVRLFSIEHNYTSDRAKIDDLMRAQGYECRYPTCSGGDGWYRKCG
jgi:FkbM family methyltransferase